MGYKITEGLGDCIVAGASIQRLSRTIGQKLDFYTSPVLEFLFDGHPNICTVNFGEGHKSLLWPSQYKLTNLFPLHTMHRFSIQLGFYIDPTDVLDVYVKGKQVINCTSEKLVLINPLSAEKTRRFIPRDIVDHIANTFKLWGYEVKFIGSAYEDSIKEIPGCVDLLSRCTVFIGPVSFLYHLASAIRTKCILFTNYMPEHKFSHFFNTIAINPDRNCTFLCEEKEKQLRDQNQCWNMCKATNYNLSEINNALNRFLNNEEIDTRV